MKSPVRVEHFRWLGDKRNQIVYDLDEIADEEVINELIESEIKLNKRKKIYLEDARYYVEDVRKYIVENYGFDKVYKQGFNIKSPINLEMQTLATQS